MAGFGVTTEAIPRKRPLLAAARVQSYPSYSSRRLISLSNSVPLRTALTGNPLLPNPVPGGLLPQTHFARTC
jgi:hypothetical protein